MFEGRRNAAKADKDGGGRDEKLFSAAKPLSTGTTRKVAMVSQHTRTKNKCETLVMIQDKLMLLDTRICPGAS